MNIDDFTYTSVRKLIDERNYWKDFTEKALNMNHEIITKALKDDSITKEKMIDMILNETIILLKEKRAEIVESGTS